MSEEICRLKASRELNWWEYYPLHKIWCNDLCPLVPRFTYRKADQYNATRFGVHWLFLNIWTLESFSFSFDVDIELNRFYVGFCLPYLRVRVGFEFFSEKWYNMTRWLSRAPRM